MIALDHHFWERFDRFRFAAKKLRYVLRSYGAKKEHINELMQHVTFDSRHVYLIADRLREEHPDMFGGLS